MEKCVLTSSALLVGTMPRRCHFKTPSFINIQALREVTKGHMVADIVAIIGSLDFVMGEVDR